MAESFVRDYMRQGLEKHRLTCVLDTHHYRAYYLHKPDATIVRGRPSLREMSTFFYFTPEGILIGGDVHPPVGYRVALNAFGYDLNWFTGHLNEDYLCEKFLERGLYAENVEEWLTDVRVNSHELWKRGIAAELLEEGVPSESDELPAFYYGALQRLEEDPDGQASGYHPGAAGWLCALQQRFAALFGAA